VAFDRQSRHPSRANSRSIASAPPRKEPVNRVGGLLLHLRWHVGLRAKRGGHVGVAQHPRGHVDGHPLAVAQLMRGWLLVLTLVNLILADAIVWLVIAQGWPSAPFANHCG
jgi:hypothetical protein